MTTTAAHAFEHDAFFYSSEREFVDTLEPFVRHGLAADEAVVAVTTPTNVAQLQHRLGGAAERVTFVDADEWYRSSGRTIANYHRALEERFAAGAPRVRVIGEVKFGETEAEQRDWVRYEAALNHVFAAQPTWIVCPYDLRSLPAPVLRDAVRTHRHVLHEGERYPSAAYERPAHLVPQLTTPAPTAHTPGAELEVDGELGTAREAVRALCAGHDLDADTAEDFAVAVNEVVTNALVHGHPPVRLRVYLDGAVLHCEVSDAGGTLGDPLAGYMPPITGGEPEAGMGLWLARQLCDVVELGAADGHTIARLRKRLR